MSAIGWFVAAVVLALWTVGTVAVTRAEIQRRTIRTRQIARRVALVGTVRATSPPLLQAGAITIRPIPDRYLSAATLSHLAST